MGVVYVARDPHSKSITTPAWPIIDEAMASSSFTLLPPVVRYFKPSLFVPTCLQTLASAGMRQHCIRMRRHPSSLTTEDPHFMPLSAISGSNSGSKMVIASKEDPVVLGIETSCDDTAAAVVGFVSIYLILFYLY